MPRKCIRKTCHTCKRDLPREAFRDIPRTDSPTTRLDATCKDCRASQQAERDRRASLVKLCECGCGRPTNPAPTTNPELGWVLGEPMRFLKGHNARSIPYPEFPYIEQDCGYDTPCWIWQFKTHKGYGRIHVNGRETGAHRHYFEQRHGPLPEGWVPDHLCKVPSCVNPDHMRPLTASDNSRWKSTTRLDWQVVREIRALAGTMSQREIGERFGIDQRHVWKILHRLIWDDAA